MKRGVLWAVILVVSVYALIALVFSFKLEQTKNPLFAQQLENGQYSTAYQFYVQSQPLVENRFFLGDANGATVVFIIDFLSEENAQSYSMHAPALQAEFASAGTLSIGHKFYITQEEYDGRKGRFIYAQAARCYQTSGGSDPVTFVQMLFTAKEEDVPVLLTSAGIDPDSCLHDQTLYEDMIETELNRISAPAMYVGITGEDNTVLYGTPSSTRVRKTVRDKQIQLGI